MISCSKCKFEISKNMKYCLKNNVCPACGSHVMNNNDLKISKHISSKLISAGFSESIFELSVFIMQNFVKIAEDETSEVETPSENSEVDEDFADQQFHGQDLKEEISEEEDSDDRVTRLKKLARNNLIKSKKGVSVRRVGAND